jgi:hypothetical protein
MSRAISATKDRGHMICFWVWMRLLILREITHFGLKLVQRTLAIQVEHNSNNEAALDLAPPVMPF